MGIQPHRFWRLSMAEWRAMLDGFADRMKMERRGQAWALSYQLVAAGCDPENVSVAALLGEKVKPKMDQETRARLHVERLLQDQAKQAKAEA